MTEEDVQKVPRSMVLKLCSSREQSHSLGQLVRDFRQVMQPYTATKLRERKANKLKDFLVMAGPLSVSHLIVFSRTKQGNTSLRIARTPRGPTLHFKVLNYSLCKDVRRFVRAPKSNEGAYYHAPPLLVLNGFTADRSAAPEEVLLTTMFQNMFPALSAQATKLSTIKRVMILNKDSKTGEIDLRHYAIEAKTVEESRAIKRLKTVKSKIHKAVPNLAQKDDIADYLLDPYGGGYTSESEVEDDAMVEIERPDKLNIKRPAPDSADLSEQQQPLSSTQKRAIKLVEIGPRLKLSLRKIEEGVCEGKILYHSYVNKSESQIKALDKKHAQKAKLKEARRKQQEENVRKKTEGKSSRMSRGKEKARVKFADADAEKDNGSDSGNQRNGEGDDGDEFEHDDEEQNFEDDDGPFAGNDSESESE